MLKKILKKFEDMNSNTVTQDMLVGDIVRLHPEVVDTLLSHGMHCLGCPSSQQESFRQEQETGFLFSRTEGECIMTALVFIALMAFSVVLAFMAKRGVIADSMDDVMVAGRSFGAFMVFFRHLLQSGLFCGRRYLPL